MTIKQMWEHSAEIAAAIDGIATAYAMTPEVPPADIMLPAIVHGPPQDGTGLVFQITWRAGVETWFYRWSMLLLVKRDGDIERDLDEVLALIQPIVAAYRLESQMGLATVYDAQPTEGRIDTVRYLDATFLGCEFIWTAWEKLPAIFR